MISDREMWMIIRMALIQIIGAIEKRWECGHRYSDKHNGEPEKPPTKPVAD